MKKWLSLFLAVIITAGVIFTFNIYGAGEKKYVALGDSIPAGYGLSSTALAYPSLFASKAGLSLANLAWSGATTQNLLEYMKTSLTCRNALSSASLVTISIGGNDLMPDVETVLTLVSGTEEEKAPIYSKLRSNLTAIIAEVKTLSPDAEIIVQNIYNPYIYSFIGILTDTAIKRANGIIKECCTGGVKFVDVAASLEKSSENFNSSSSDDFIDCHPTAKGHVIIADLIYAAYSGTSSTTTTTTTTTSFSYETLVKTLPTGGKYTLDNYGFLYGVKSGDTAGAVLSDMTSGGNLRIVDAKGNIATGTALIGTGYRLELYEGGELTGEAMIIIAGDLTCDGKITITDCMRLRAYQLGKISVDFKAERAAIAVVPGSDKVTIVHYQKLRAYQLGKIVSFE